MCREWQILDDLRAFGLEDDDSDTGAFLFTMSAEPALVRRVIEAQLEDPEARLFLDDILSESGLEGWRICSDQGLRYHEDRKSTRLNSSH